MFEQMPATACAKGLIVGSYRSDNRDSYLDWQEFAEDSLFEFLLDHQGFDEASQGTMLPVMMQRQSSSGALDQVTDLLQLLRIEFPHAVLDIPYLYSGFSPHFAALVFDTGQQYLAVFLKRSHS